MQNQHDQKESLMEIKVHTRNLHLTPRLESYIDKKVDRLERYLSNIIEANLELKKEGRTGQPVAQLTIRHKKGVIFRAEDKKQQDIFASVDVVVDKMYRQLERHKSKRRRRKGSERWTDVDMSIPIDDEEIVELEVTDEEEGVEIVRRKNVLLTPMNEEEAIEQIELLGHDFFVFLNGDTGLVNVLYKRQDDQYGLLVAEHD
jgi:putative sigma-54 modulation protein